MKGIDDLDYYELLEIPSSASPAEIERAYRLAQQTYAEGSLALYSVFESADAAAIRSRLDEAHDVLLDPEARRVHDRDRSPKDPETGSAWAGSNGFAFGGSRGSAGPALEDPGDLDEIGGARDRAVSRDRNTAIDGGLAGVEDLDEEYDLFDDDAHSEFDGLRLRRARLFRGYEIDEISQVTKVNGTHLRNIEEENYADLPADVYVRGFVTAYARTIGLDPQRVVPSYMARMQESRNEGSRSRFLGRR